MTKRDSRFGNRKGVYRGVPFDSRLERKFLDLCYRHGVRVVRSTLRIPYLDGNGVPRTYLPDFYLPDFKHTVEVKGEWAIRIDHAWVSAKSLAALKLLGEDNYSVVTEVTIKGRGVSHLFRRLHEKANSR